MLFCNLDSDGDWNFGEYVSDQKAIELNILTRLREWVGDCFFNNNAGIDWNNRLGKPVQTDAIAADVKNIILQSDGVVGIIDFSVTLSLRTLSISYTINTIYTQNAQNTINLIN